MARADEAEQAGRLLEAIDAAPVGQPPERDVPREASPGAAAGPGRAPAGPRPGPGRVAARGQDLFADRPDQLPEVALAELDLATLSSGIGYHGGLLVRQLFSPDRVAQFVEGIDRSFEAYDCWAQGAPGLGDLAVVRRVPARLGHPQQDAAPLVCA